VRLYHFHPGKYSWILYIRCDWDSFMFTAWIACVGGFSVFYWTPCDWLGYESGYVIFKPDPDVKPGESIAVAESCVWRHAMEEEYQ
jgi:hypothetical protein